MFQADGPGQRLPAAAAKLTSMAESAVHKVDMDTSLELALGAGEGERLVGRRESLGRWIGGAVGDQRQGEATGRLSPGLVAVTDRQMQLVGEGAKSGGLGRSFLSRQGDGQAGLPERRAQAGNPRPWRVCFACRASRAICRSFSQS